MHMPPNNATEHPVWGEGVRVLRGINGLSQTQLAEQAGTTQATISRLEVGTTHEISDSLRIRIARALHTDPHALFPYREDGVA